MLRPTARGALPTNVDSGDVRVPGGLRRLQSGWDGRSPSGGFDSRPSPPRGPRTSADVFRNRHTLGLFEIRFTDVRGRLRSVTLIAAGKLTVDYASTINRAQGSAVDEAHLIVDDRINVQQLYVGLPVDPARALEGSPAVATRLGFDRASDQSDSVSRLGREGRETRRRWTRVESRARSPWRQSYDRHRVRADAERTSTGAAKLVVVDRARDSSDLDCVWRFFLPRQDRGR
jgi:hypothetical protein